MQKLFIKGKKEISGNISISGSKNATLPILAASLLANEVKLSNVPFVKDIFTMIELLKFIGIIVKIKKDNRIIDGHHRFLTTVLINPKIKVNCLKIDLPIRELLPLTLAYTDAIGNVRNK